MNFKNFINYRTGESLAESILALSVLAIGMTLSGVVMATSLRNVGSSRERMIAVNIAREGIEAVKNIRDTNWLKFSNDRRNCWNHLPGTPDTCDRNTPKIVHNRAYIVYLNQKNEWRLTTNTTTQKANLSLVDIDSGFDSNGDQNKTNDQDIYNHLVGNDSLGRETKKTTFERQIRVFYLSPTNATNGTFNDNRMKITSTVYWKEKSTTKSLTLETIITDYLGRENLSE